MGAYIGGVSSSGEFNPAKWDGKDWAWAAVGAVAGGVIGYGLEYHGPYRGNPNIRSTHGNNAVKAPTGRLNYPKASMNNPDAILPRTYYKPLSPAEKIGLSFAGFVPSRPAVTPINSNSSPYFPEPLAGQSIPFSESIRYNWRKVSVIDEDRTLVTELARTLKSDPTLSLNILANVGVSSQEVTEGQYQAGYSPRLRNQSGFFIDNNGNIGTAGQAMIARGRSLRNMLIKLGVNPAQLSIGFGGIIVNSDVTSFIIRKIR